MSRATLYHESSQKVEFPEIRTARYNKDFYFGYQLPYGALSFNSALFCRIGGAR